MLNEDPHVQMPTLSQLSRSVCLWMLVCVYSCIIHWFVQLPTCEVGTVAKDWMESSLQRMGVCSRRTKKGTPKTISKMEKSLGVVMDKFVASHFEAKDKYSGTCTCGVGTEVIEFNTRL